MHLAIIINLFRVDKVRFIHFVKQYTLVHSSIDNFRSPIHVFDWLICRCENLIPHEKQKLKCKKRKFYEENKKVPKRYKKT